MTERPILFSAPMVRAILAGTKTQTRRVAKPQPIYDGRFAGGWKIQGKAGRESSLRSPMLADLCPYGQPGERLWVRETWLRHSPNVPNDFLYRADHSDDDIIGPAHGGWKPSIHMPRAASRITLEITGVRVERLQDISEADALAEGISSVRSQSWDRQHFPEWRFLFDEAVQAGTKPPIGPSPAKTFEKLWASINGPDSWAANPWVWVVEFKRAV